MVTIHDVSQGSTEWHQIREGKFTGSNAHKLLRYGASEYAKTTNDSFKGNYWTKRGHILEDECLELYQSIKNISVGRPGFVTNDKFDNAGYSPDALTDDLVLEVKCFDVKKHLQVFNSDIPLEIQAQVQYGMMICEKKLAHLVIYNPTLEPAKAFKIIPIKANKNIQANFKRILSK